MSSATTQTLISLAAVRALRAEREARLAGDQALREGLLSSDAVAALVEAALPALIARDPSRFAGEPGRAPTEGEIAAAVAEYLAPRIAELRGTDGVTPSRAELIALIESVIRDDPERFRGPKGEPGKPGRGIASVRIDMAGDLVITTTDGSSTNVGHVVGRDGEPGRNGEKLVVVGGGAGAASAGSVLRLQTVTDAAGRWQVDYAATGWATITGLSVQAMGGPFLIETSEATPTTSRGRVWHMPLTHLLGRRRQPAAAVTVFITLTGA